MTDDNGGFGRRDVKVTIVVRAWVKDDEAWDMTFHGLDRICETVDRSRINIILVANDSIGNPEVVNDYVDVFVGLRENMGAVRATNAGLQLAMLDPSEFILVLDNDTLIPAGDFKILDRWLAHFDDDEVGAVGAMSDYVSGYQNVINLQYRYTKEVEKSNEGGKGYTGPVYAPWLISFACMYRKISLMTCPPPELTGSQIAERTQNGSFPLRLDPTELQRAWFWDERFEPGNSEDLDISYRLAFRGWKQVVATDVYVHHQGSVSFREYDFKALVEKNRQKLLEKWGVHVLRATGVVRS